MFVNKIDMSKKYFSSILASLAMLVFAVSAAAQMTVTGEIIDVIDGKTVIISIPTGKVRAELQYIDVPVGTQQLSETVREHLRNLVFGKIVLYRAQTLFKDRTVGRLLVNNIDVSQQMLRDGAAWHVLNRSGQEKVEMENYASSESDARNEKRGVWSIPDLKQSLTSQQIAAQVDPVIDAKTSSNFPETPKAKGKWGDKNPSLGNVGALVNGYNAETRSGYVGTSYLAVPDSELDKKIGANNRRTAGRHGEVFSLYTGERQRGCAPHSARRTPQGCLLHPRFRT